MSDTGYPKVGEIILPSGEVVAVFPGGLQIPVASAGPTSSLRPNERVQWLRASNGAVLAEITGGWFAAGPGIGSTYLNLDAQDAGIGLKGATGGASEVTATANGEEATVLRGDGASDFLRVARTLAGMQDLVANVGTAEAVFTGSVPGEATTTGILHRLGRPPIFAAAVPIDNGAIFWNVGSQGVTDSDASTVTFGFQFNNGAQAGGTLSFAWLAIG